jgi:Protein of unknown function (DUF3515)
VLSGSTVRSAGTPRWPLVMALTLVAALVVGVLIAASLVRNQPLAPLGLATVPAPAAGSADCTRLLAALPEQLDGGAHGALDRRHLSAPAPAGAAGWGEPPVVLRCGLDRPGAFVVGSPIQVVDQVQWFEAERGSAGDADRSTWYTVDRPVYLALTLPPGSGPTPIQQLSEAIDHTMAAVPIDPAPAR